MDFEIEHRGEVTLIRLIGARLDANTSRLLKTLVEGQIAEQHNRIILDFEAVRFLDSSGLGVLVTLMKFLRAPGGLVICHIKDRTIQDILHLTRMDQVFNIKNSLEEALELLTAIAD